LLQGESGTGKELIARAIHDCSDRVDQPFVAINCGAIPRDLLESELFGHEKGAFTGAIAKKIGCFEQADGGTLFLDEIGDLDLDLQVKLLRVLQDNQIQPVGAVKKIKVNVRIISATHRNLANLMTDQKFREDLFFRLNVYPLQVPALRERPEDIPLLVDHFLDDIQKKYDSPKPHITEHAMNQLLDYCWKGNVRELENMMKRLVLVMDPDKEVDQIPDEMFQFKNEISDQPQTAAQKMIPARTDLVTSLADTEKASIETALKHFNYNILKTAQALKIGRDTLYRKIKLYDINNPGHRVST
ncbi:MAG: sigma-54 dependent transcriptional regulator, partial [Spirochaetota bacterium]|nr:sigma-54 dependent transcriptional regulator [Spirochaetota bacterium]